MTDRVNFPQTLNDLQQYVTAYEKYEAQRTFIQTSGGTVARFIRAEFDVSLRKFAVMLDVSPSFLSKVERGIECLPPDVANRLLCLHNARGE